MSSSGIRKFKTFEDRTIELIVNQESNFIGALKVTGTESSFGGVVGLGTATSGGPGAPVGNFLEVAGGSMAGPIAYSPQLVTVDVDNNVNIGFQQGAFSTYIRVTATGATDDLENIIGAHFSGQDIILQGTDTKTITLKTTGNIIPPGEADFDLVDDKIIRGVFDEIQNKWVFYTSSGGGGGSIPDGTLENQHLEWDDTAGEWKAVNDIDMFVGVNARAIHNLDGLDFISDTAVAFGNFSIDETSGLEALNLNLPDTTDFTISDDAVIKWRFIPSTSEITFDGGGSGITNFGHLDFVNNLATPSATFSIYSNGTDLIARTSSGSSRNLDRIVETPMTRNLDAGDNDLTNLQSLFFNETNNAILADPVGMLFRTATTDRFDWEVAGTGIVMTLNTTTLGLGVDLAMPTGGNILGGGSDNGMTNIGHLDFIDNLSSPGATFSIYSDGTDLFANTGSKVVNLDDIPQLALNETVTGLWTFDDIIRAGGAGFGMDTIGHLDFVDNLATPGATFSIYSDGTDLVANTGSHVTNFDNLPELTIANTFTAINTFNANIVGGGAGEGLSNIGQLIFVDNLATPGGIAIYSDGTDIFTTATWNFNLKNLESVTDIILRDGFNTSKLFFDGGVDTYMTGSGITGRINFFMDGNNKASFDPTGLVLAIDTYLTVDERTSNPAALTAKGIFFVKEVSGNAEPWFVGQGVTAQSLLGGGAGGATIELDNLGTTSINAQLNLQNGVNIIPEDFGSVLGDSTHTFGTSYFTRINFDLTTRFIAGTGALDMIVEVPSGGNMFFREAGTNFWELDGDSNQCVFYRDIALTSGEAIRSHQGAEIGFFVTNTTVAVGSAGSMQIPTTTTTIGSNSQLNTAFGSAIGCMGIYDTDTSVPILAIKIQSNKWALITFPDNAITVVGDHVT